MPAQDIRPCLAETKISNLARVKAFWQVPTWDLIAEQTLLVCPANARQGFGAIADTALQKDPANLAFSCGLRSKPRSEAARLAITRLARDHAEMAVSNDTRQKQVENGPHLWRTEPRRKVLRR